MIAAESDLRSGAPQIDTGAQRSSPNEFYVTEFRFEGNSVFSDPTLAEVVAPYLDRNITANELEQARQALTLYYVNHGYINSGAVVKSLTVEQGVFSFRIVEGTLSKADIHIYGLDRLRPAFVRKNLHRGAGQPLDLNRLKDAIQLLKQNPNIKSIKVELQPKNQAGETVLGESVLDVNLEQDNPFTLETRVRNDRPPSVGAELVEILVSHENVLGFSDRMNLRYGVLKRSESGFASPGFENWGAGYSIPILPIGTSMGLSYEQNDDSLLEEPFAALNILNEVETFDVNIRHPLYRTSRRELAISLIAQHRQSETFLLGEPFSLSPGAVDGKEQISILRFATDWSQSSSNQAFAARLSLNWGPDILSSTDNGTARDGKFVSLVGQTQYLRKLGTLWDMEHQLLLRGVFQWANDPLLSLERFKLGGSHTVRGYRENSLIRDTGLIGNAELRMGLPWKNRSGTSILTVAPFFDFGIGWNEDDIPAFPKHISSVGVGLIFSPNKRFYGRIDWGHALRNLNFSNNDLQDEGIHFRAGFKMF